MRIIIDILSDRVVAKFGTYSTTVEVPDMPDDPVEALELLYDEQVISELLRDLTNEIV